MSNYQWPREALSPRKVTCQPVPGTIGGGVSITGLEQVIASDAGYWRIVLDEIPIAGVQRKRLWNAMAVRLQGRLNLCDVPIYDDAAPWPVVGGIPVEAYYTPHSDGSTLSDGGEYETDSIVATSVGGAVAGSSSIVINMAAGSALGAGISFSWQGAVKNRLYRIMDITSLLETQFTCSIWPPVRETILNGDALNFNNPVLTCRLATDTEIDSGSDDYAGRTLAMVTFLEALP